MTADRWDRLADTLREHGIPCGVIARPYPGGVSRHIYLRRGDTTIVIADQWWRKNQDVWLGWQVWAEGADSIVTWESQVTKKRSEVLAAVRIAEGK